MRKEHIIYGKKYKKILYIIAVALFFSCFINPIHIYAKEEHIKSLVIDLNEMESGSYVFYEDADSGYKIIIDIIDQYNNIMLMDYHNSGWSGGTIPGPTRTLYPHVSGGNFDGTGFYEDVKISGGVEIISVYNASIKRPSTYNISNVSCKILNKKASSSPAKATLSFNCYYTIFGPGGYNESCYLSSEINKNGQFKVIWRLP